MLRGEGICERGGRGGDCSLGFCVIDLGVDIKCAFVDCLYGWLNLHNKFRG